MYSFVGYLYVNGSGPVTSEGEERAYHVICYYVVSVGEVSSSSGCLGWATLLAHLSQRLIGELIVYSCSGVRPSVVRRRRRTSSTISNIFFSETAGPIKAKFYLEPPWVGGTIFCSRHLGHMTKMAAMPIYGKNPSKIFFSRTGRRIFTKLGM